MMRTHTTQHQDFVEWESRQTLVQSTVIPPHGPLASGAPAIAAWCRNHCNYWPLFDELCVPVVWARGAEIVEVNDALCSWLGYENGRLAGAPLCQLAPSKEWRSTSSPWHAIAASESVVKAVVGISDAAGTTCRATVTSFSMSGQSPYDRLLLLRPAHRSEIFARDLAQQSALAYELAAVEARERRKIANGLHDEIGQVLAIIGLKLAALGTSSRHNEIADQVRELLSFVAQAQQATRSATFELSCPVLQQMGLQSAIENLAERLNGVAGISISVHGVILATAIPRPRAEVAFRIVRELLMNALKHSRARRVWIDIAQRGAELCFAVVDDGVGMLGQMNRPNQTGGYGLHNVEAQIQAVGGWLALSPTASGTHIEFALPLSRIAPCKVL
jgi:signal transduction histidine kinase